MATNTPLVDWKTCFELKICHSVVAVLTADLEFANNHPSRSVRFRRVIHQVHVLGFIADASFLEVASRNERKLFFKKCNSEKSELQFDVTCCQFR